MPPTAPNTLAHASARRGSVYVLVLATATIAAAAALGGIALAQASQRSVLATSDWDRATLAAQSGLDIAINLVNQDPNWKMGISSGIVLPTIRIDSSRVRLAFVDETDADFTAGSDPVRVYAAASNNKSVRVLSVLGTFSSSTPLDLLRTPLHSAMNVTLSSAMTAQGGPVSSNSELTVNSTLTGSAEAKAIVNNGTITGFATSDAPAKAMPSAAIFESLATRAAPVNIVLSPTTFQSVLWSAGRSPALVTNAEGLYCIKTSAGQIVEFTNLRVRATILVRLAAGATLNIRGSVLWEPANPSLPALIVKAENGSSINFSGSTTALKEVLLVGNFNPPGDPYQGATDNDTSDSYPPCFGGIIHIIGTNANVSIGQDFKLIGCLISESPVVVNQNCSLSADPALFASPPLGYSNPTYLRPSRGTLRWETADTFHSVTGQNANDN